MPMNEVDPEPADNLHEVSHANAFGPKVRVGVRLRKVTYALLRLWTTMNDIGLEDTVDQGTRELIYRLVAALPPERRRIFWDAAESMVPEQYLPLRRPGDGVNIDALASELKAEQAAEGSDATT